jgi:hypothetical protein
MILVANNQMIKTFTPDRSNQTFDMAVLPRAAFSASSAILERAGLRSAGDMIGQPKEHEAECGVTGRAGNTLNSCSLRMLNYGHS